MQRGVVKVSIFTLLTLFVLCAQPDKDRGMDEFDMKRILSVIPRSANDVSVTKGSLDGDDKAEFVVTYRDSTKGVFLTILDQSHRRIFETGIATDQVPKGHLIDMDGDGILDVIISGRSRGGKSLQVIRNANGAYVLVGDFWGLEVKFLDEDDDGKMEVEVENRDFDRDPDRHTVHTFYRWDGEGFSPFRSYKVSKRIIF